MGQSFKDLHSAVRCCRHACLRHRTADILCPYKCQLVENRAKGFKCTFHVPARLPRHKYAFGGNKGFSIA